MHPGGDMSHLAGMFRNTIPADDSKLDPHPRNRPSFEPSMCCQLVSRCGANSRESAEFAYPPVMFINTPYSGPYPYSNCTVPWEYSSDRLRRLQLQEQAKSAGFKAVLTVMCCCCCMDTSKDFDPPYMY